MSLDIYLDIYVDTGGPEPYMVRLFNANYTSNVVPMWQLAGVYDALYLSEGKTAGEVKDAVLAGYLDMKLHPEKYRPLNPPNGWGDYETALAFLGRFLDACVAHPKAVIRVWK